MQPIHSKQGKAIHAGCRRQRRRHAPVAHVPKDSSYLGSCVFRHGAPSRASPTCGGDKCT
eukprot:6842057-Pyramimonas_sp.AAC.1